MEVSREAKVVALFTNGIRNAKPFKSATGAL
jgi:hypothetical protein